MVQELKVNMLNIYLCKRGPFMYYYKEDKDGLNAEIIKHIHSISNLHPKLHVLQIEWSDQIKRYPNINKDENKYIYVYFESINRHKIFNPTKKEIDCLFIKCIQYHNYKISNMINNIGRLGKKNPKYGTDPLEPRYIKQNSVNGQTELEYNRNLVEYRKIKSPIYSDDLINEFPQNCSLQKLIHIHRKRMPKTSVNI